MIPFAEPQTTKTTPTAKELYENITIALHTQMENLASGELMGTDIYQFMKLVMIMNEAFRRKSSGKLQTLCDQLLLDLKVFVSKYDPDSNAPLLVTEEFYDQLERLAMSFDKLIDERRLTEQDLLYITTRVTNYLTIGEAKRRGMNTDEVVVASSIPTPHALNVSVLDIVHGDISVAKRTA